MKQFQLAKELRDAVKLQKLLKSKPESFWQQRGEVMALRLFHEMAGRVPAYREFLKTHNFNPKNVKTIEDYKNVPLISKDNYLRKYPLEQLCWDGDLVNRSTVVSATSGSTGEPFYFPRTDLQDEFYALTAELYLRENFQIHKKTTLYIDAFAMGIWIGGVFTYEAVHRVAQKGYALSVITPGINKVEVINAVRRLGPQFDQVIIGCYPPLLRDIVDLGIEEGLDWGEYNLGVVFSAEGFSEEFRDYIARHGQLSNIYTSTLNHYGTVDLGTMSHETPLAVMVRRLVVGNKALFKALFGTTKLPTLTQYLPEMFYFEEVDGGVVCTSYSGLPLVRYDLKDHGGVINLSTVGKTLVDHGKDLGAELDKNNLSGSKWNLPFVYVYERSDFSVTFVGAQIYPEEIRRVLLQPAFSGKLTDKFTMEVKFDEAMNSQLVINCELKNGHSPDDELAREFQVALVASLLAENSEYASNYSSYGAKIDPIIKLWPHGDPIYFNGKGKQGWVKKTTTSPAASPSL